MAGFLKPGPRWAILAFILLALGVKDVLSNTLEQERRHKVLAGGIEAPATIRESAGAQAVSIRWTDAAGRTRTAVAWTGKAFARQAHAGDPVAIKFVDDPALEPVILSEAAERDRVNAWWITSGIGYMVVSAVLFAVAMIGTFRARKVR